MANGRVPSLVRVGLQPAELHPLPLVQMARLSPVAVTWLFNCGTRTQVNDCVTLLVSQAGLCQAGLPPSPLARMVRPSPVVVAQPFSFGICNLVNGYVFSLAIQSQLSPSLLARIGISWSVEVVTTRLRFGSPVGQRLDRFV